MTNTIPTIDNLTDAHNLLRALREQSDWVSVFRDRGWGDSGQTPEITIIVDGDGHDPKAHITPEVYRQLVDQRIVGKNSYAGFKARRIHDFEPPAPEPKTGPDNADLAEQVIREAFAADLAQASVKVAFFRGLTGHVFMPIAEDVVYTAGFRRGQYVNLSPGASDMVVTGWIHDERGFGDTVGEAVHVRFPLSGGVLDRDAFRALLLDAVRAKTAEVESAHRV